MLLQFQRDTGWKFIDKDPLFVYVPLSNEKDVKVRN